MRVNDGVIVMVNGALIGELARRGHTAINKLDTWIEDSDAAVGNVGADPWECNGGAGDGGVGVSKRSGTSGSIHMFKSSSAGCSCALAATAMMSELIHDKNCFTKCV